MDSAVTPPSRSSRAVRLVSTFYAQLCSTALLQTGTQGGMRKKKGLSPVFAFSQIFTGTTVHLCLILSLSLCFFVLVCAVLFRIDALQAGPEERKAAAGEGSADRGCARCGRGGANRAAFGEWPRQVGAGRQSVAVGGHAPVRQRCRYIKKMRRGDWSSFSSREEGKKIRRGGGGAPTREREIDVGDEDKAGRRDEQTSRYTV